MNKHEIFDSLWAEHKPLIDKAFDEWFADPSGTLALPIAEQQKIIENMHEVSYHFVYRLRAYLRAQEERSENS